MHFDEIKETLQLALDYIGKYYELCLSVWDTFPLGLHFFVKTAYILAIIGIILGLLNSVTINWKNWKEKPDTNLMYSYFGGSGNYQRKLIYTDAIKLLQDWTWSWISAAGLAYRLGNLKNESKCLMFLCSIVYLPLAACGLIEMAIRVVIGWLAYFLLNLAWFIVLTFLQILSFILTPLFRAIDRGQRVEQHCTHCYATFNLPYFKCPHCGKMHQRLIPGNTGFLVARCSCGHFISCSMLTKRSKYDAVCPNPKCNTDLVASNAKQFSIQVIGGNASGKTAFIAAFQHLYIENCAMQQKLKVTGSPKETFAELDKMFTDGLTVSSPEDEVGVFNLVHNIGGISSQNLVLYDIPDEIILSGQYEKNPLNFGYSDGIVILVDPLSVYLVREAYKKEDSTSEFDSYSSDDSEDIILNFINKFSEIAGRSARKMSSIPVAVLIAKADLSVVKRKIGLPKIKSVFAAKPEAYQNRIENARNEICHQYLMDIGLANVVNNLDSVFSVINYFPISSIGHTARCGQPFEPTGVVEPVAWIVQTGRSSMAPYLSWVQSIVTADGFQEAKAGQNLENRYRKAETLLAEKKYAEALKAFSMLYNYKDSTKKVAALTDMQYQVAVQNAEQGNFDAAIRLFTSLGTYKDSKVRVLAVKKQKVEWLLNAKKYKDAIELLKTLPQDKENENKLLETQYEYATYLTANGDCISAKKIFEMLGSYKDSAHKNIYLLSGLIRQGEKRNLQFGKYRWRVLRIQEDTALIITEQVIGKNAYHSMLSDVTWEFCSLRQYLNTKVINQFSEDEIKLIVPSKVKTPDNQQYGTSGGNITVDKLFALSLEEVELFFVDDKDRVVSETGSVQAADWWWLRTTGGASDYAAIVDKNGKANAGGNRVNNPYGGIRVALWIRL